MTKSKSFISIGSRLRPKLGKNKIKFPESEFDDDQQLVDDFERQDNDVKKTKRKFTFPGSEEPKTKKNSVPDFYPADQGPIL